MALYAESIGREFEVEEDEECLGRELIAGVNDGYGSILLMGGLEAPSSIEPSIVEANSRSTSSNSLRFRARIECILTSKSRFSPNVCFVLFHISGAWPLTSGSQWSGHRSRFDNHPHFCHWYLHVNL